MIESSLVESGISMRDKACSEVNFGSGDVVWNDLYFDAHSPLEMQRDDLRDDLLFVRYPNGCVIDVGWLPEFDVAGSYFASLNCAPDRYDPSLQIECHSITELHAALKRLVALAETVARE
jgi:hypothetical protein